MNSDINRGFLIFLNKNVYVYDLGVGMQEERHY